jgi:cysteine synthase A
VPDPEGSVFGEYYGSGDATLTAAGSRIEGIGRPRVEASFIRSLIDRMEEVSNKSSVAGMRVLSRLLGRKVGPSTGTNFASMLKLASELSLAGEQGSIVSLLCDSGERYLRSYHDPAWVFEQFGDCSNEERALEQSLPQ